MVATAGTRARDDEYARAKKVRFEKAELVEYV